MVTKAAQANTPTFWAAPDAVESGYSVFPVGPDKTPSVTGGYYAATRNVRQIAA